MVLHCTSSTAAQAVRRRAVELPIWEKIIDTKLQKLGKEADNKH